MYSSIDVVTVRIETVEAVWKPMAKHSRGGVGVTTYTSDTDVVTGHCRLRSSLDIISLLVFQLNLIGFEPRTSDLDHITLALLMPTISLELLATNGFSVYE